MWVLFAAAAMTKEGFVTPQAAGIADQMLKEFDKRFEGYSSGYGEGWLGKTEEKKS